ncbi:MAG: sulfotransferase family protein [Candidatus Binatia bacterium]
MTVMVFSFFKRREPLTQPPLVIGALGGSGTRVVTLIARHAGWWMGRRVHRKTEDSLAMRPFLNEWFETILQFPDISPQIHKRLVTDFHRAITAHRKGIPSPNAPWGWKNPRNMWLIPFYVSIYPRLKFIHAIRDGRDMSLSRNLFLLKNHGDSLLGPSWKDNPEAAQMEAWRRGNLRAAEAANHCAPGNYFLLRYEDLCLNPRPTVEKLFEFLGAAGSSIDRAVSEVLPSSGIGRWQTVPGAANAPSLSLSAQSTLRRFGYPV